MTIERAIEILDPEHREHYESIEIVNEACRMGMKALQLMLDNNIIENDVTALADVLSYNGYDDEIIKIYEYIKNNNQEFHVSYLETLPNDVDSPPRIFWSYLSMKYGDYGTSPRFGWIDNENKNTILEQLEESSPLWEKTHGI